MLFIQRIANERIRKAMDEGEFDRLQGKGKPLDLKEDPGVPEELRMAFKVLKNAGLVPPELELRKEMINLQELIDLCEDEAQLQIYRQKLSLKRIQIESMLERRQARLPKGYRRAVHDKLGV